MSSAIEGAFAGPPERVTGPPPESETAHVASAGRIDEQGTTDSVDYATQLGAEQESKAVATLGARFALAGYELTRNTGGAGQLLYSASRWGLSHALPDLDAAARWLEQATGRRAT